MHPKNLNLNVHDALYKLIKTYDGSRVSLAYKACVPVEEVEAIVRSWPGPGLGANVSADTVLRLFESCGWVMTLYPPQAPIVRASDCLNRDL